MSFNIIMHTNTIITQYDLTGILSAMVGCSATFVAIIGGLIANKGLADRAEKESIDRQLSQTSMEIDIIDTRIDNLNSWLNTYNAREFIDENIDELLMCRKLSSLHISDSSADITEEELLPYWDSALEGVKKFRDNMSNERNINGIPVNIVEELTPFQYEICSSYHRSIEKGESILIETAHITDTSSYRISIYNEKVKELEDCIQNKERLVLKEQMLRDRKQDITLGKSVKNGISVFVLVAIFNIIMPILFMLFNPTPNKYWYLAETFVSILLFAVGILAMIKYICSLFPEKKEVDNSNKKENKNE